MFDLGGGELLLILLAVLIFFGPKKLPELAQGLGKGIRQFRKAQQDINDQFQNAMRDEDRKERQKTAAPINPNTISRTAAGTTTTFVTAEEKDKTSTEVEAAGNRGENDAPAPSTPPSDNLIGGGADIQARINQAANSPGQPPQPPAEWRENRSGSTDS